MARVPLSVYSLIVLISFAHHPVSSTTTSITLGINATVASPNSSTPTTQPVQTTTHVFIAPVSSVVSTSSGNVTTTSNTSVIAPTPSSNVISSTSVPAGPPATKKFEARITVNETYRAKYSNPNSIEFRTFASNFSEKVGQFLQGQLSGFKRVNVTELRNGSVVVDFDIEVETSSNATEDSISKALIEGSGAPLGYTILGKPIVNATHQPPPPSTQTVTPSTPVTKPTTAPPTCATKGTEIWDKAIDLATPMGTFIIVVVAVALILILLIALICVCCKYRSLKKRTHFPDHMAINDSEWIRSSDDLLMWERNLRASEVKTTNGVSNRPINEKRT